MAKGAMVFKLIYNTQFKDFLQNEAKIGTVHGHNNRLKF